jgi:hypothetical protein
MCNLKPDRDCRRRGGLALGRPAGGPPDPNHEYRDSVVRRADLQFSRRRVPIRLGGSESGGRGRRPRPAPLAASRSPQYAGIAESAPGPACARAALFILSSARRLYGAVSSALVQPRRPQCGRAVTGASVRGSIIRRTRRLRRWQARLPRRVMSRGHNLFISDYM